MGVWRSLRIEYPGAFYLGIQRSAVSQMSRRFAETVKGNQELRKVLSKTEKEDFLNVAAWPHARLLGFYST